MIKMFILFSKNLHLRIENIKKIAKICKKNFFYNFRELRLYLLSFCTSRISEEWIHFCMLNSSKNE